MARIYHDEDADLAALDGSTLAVLGYGNQGRSQALNLRDSGIAVVVGKIRDAASERAEADGFEVLPVAEACELYLSGELAYSLDARRAFRIGDARGD